MPTHLYSNENNTQIMCIYFLIVYTRHWWLLNIKERKWSEIIKYLNWPHNNKTIFYYCIKSKYTNIKWPPADIIRSYNAGWLYYYYHLLSITFFFQIRFFLYIFNFCCMCCWVFVNCQVLHFFFCYYRSWIIKKKFMAWKIDNHKTIN